jgi:hypothetical protein
MRFNKLWYNEAPIPGSKKWKIAYSIGASVIATLLSSPILGVIDDDKTALATITYGGDYTPAHTTTYTSPASITIDMTCQGEPCSGPDLIESFVNPVDITYFMTYLDKHNEIIGVNVTSQGNIIVLPQRVLQNPNAYQINYQEISPQIGDPVVCNVDLIPGRSYTITNPEYTSPYREVNLGWPLPLPIAWPRRRKQNVYGEDSSEQQTATNNDVAQQTSVNAMPVTQSNALPSKVSSGIADVIDNSSFYESFYPITTRHQQVYSTSSKSPISTKFKAIQLRIKELLLPPVDHTKTRAVHTNIGTFVQLSFENPDQQLFDKRLRFYKAVGLFSSVLALSGLMYAHYNSEQHIGDGCGIEYSKSSDTLIPSITNNSCDANGKPKEQITGLKIQFAGCSNLNLADALPDAIVSVIIRGKGADDRVLFEDFGIVSPRAVLEKAVRINVDRHNASLVR